MRRRPRPARVGPRRPTSDRADPRNLQGDPQPDHDREQPARNRGDPAHIAGDVRVFLGLSNRERDAAAHGRIAIGGSLLPVACLLLGLRGLPLLGDELRLELGGTRFLFGRQGRGSGATGAGSEAFTIRVDRWRGRRCPGRLVPRVRLAMVSRGPSIWMIAAAGWAVTPAAQDSTRRDPGTSAVRPAC